MAEVEKSNSGLVQLPIDRLTTQLNMISIDEKASCTEPELLFATSHHWTDTRLSFVSAGIAARGSTPTAWRRTFASGWK